MCTVFLVKIPSNSDIQYLRGVGGGGGILPCRTTNLVWVGGWEGRMGDRGRGSKVRLLETIINHLTWRVHVCLCMCKRVTVILSLTQSIPLKRNTSVGGSKDTVNSTAYILFGPKKGNWTCAVDTLVSGCLCLDAFVLDAYIYVCCRVFSLVMTERQVVPSFWEFLLLSFQKWLERTFHPRKKMLLLQQTLLRRRRWEKWWRTAREKLRVCQQDLVQRALMIGWRNEPGRRGSWWSEGCASPPGPHHC